MRDSEPLTKTLFYLVCAGILYGSLFPFDFSLAAAGDALPVFLASWSYAPGVGDILGNIALFIPFGLLACLLVRGGHYTVATVCLAWLLVALGAQLLQLFLPSRDPAIFDLYTNAAGTVAGWQLARRLPADLHLEGGHTPLDHYLPLCLVLAWLAAQLLPFVPSIDLQSYKDALKPLVLEPRFSWHDCLLQAVAWFAALYLVQQTRPTRLPVPAVLAGFGAILALKVVIVLNSVSVTDVGAMALAFTAWVVARMRSLAPASLAVILLLAWLVDGVSPFVLRHAPDQFNPIPFSGFLEGSMLVNVIALCQKGFVFGVIAFLGLAADGRWLRRALVVAVLLLGLEIAQVYLRPGNPEITDPLLFLALAWVVQRLRNPRALAAVGEHHLATAARGRVPLVYGRRKVLLVVAGYVLTCSLALKVLLGLPGVPYNVVELFRFGASGVDLVFFSLALASIGWGGAWLGRVLVTAARPFREVFFGFCAVATVSFVLLWVGVTQESILDIMGSSVFVHRVMERGVLGQPGVWLFELLGPGNIAPVTRVVEPVIRFAALFGPLFIFLALCLAPLWRTALSTSEVYRRSPADWAAVAAIVLLLLVLAKVIAFDWSSTDNLNELIAHDGEWGLGGGGYLYLLVFVLCAAAALLTAALGRGVVKIVVALAVLVATLPLTWWLLNHGLGQEVEKYGRTFSGVDFLLGPDRDNLISRQALFARWSGVHGLGIIGLAFGASLCFAWNKAARGDSRAAASVESGGPAPRPIAVGEFRLYREQAAFLRAQSLQAGKSVNELANDILAYFSRELSNSPASVEAVRGYLGRSGAGEQKVFAQRPVRLQLNVASRQVLDLVDPKGVHSDSRVFRKLLEVFMEAAAEEADNEGGPIVT